MAVFKLSAVFVGCIVHLFADCVFADCYELENCFDRSGISSYGGSRFIEWDVMNPYPFLISMCQNATAIGRCFARHSDCKTYDDDAIPEKRTEKLQQMCTYKETLKAAQKCSNTVLQNSGTRSIKNEWNLCHSRVGDLENHCRKLEYIESCSVLGTAGIIKCYANVMVSMAKINGINIPCLEMYESAN